MSNGVAVSFFVGKDLWQAREHKHHLRLDYVCAEPLSGRFTILSHTQDTSQKDHRLGFLVAVAKFDQRSSNTSFLSFMCSVLSQLMELVRERETSLHHLSFVTAS